MNTLESLHNRIDLVSIPFTERGSRLLVFRKANTLFVRLAERWVKYESSLGHYRQRAPILDEFCFLDEHGQPLELTMDTYPHVVHVTTPAGRFTLTFFDTETLLVRLPAGKYGFTFTGYSDRGHTDRRGGVLHGVRTIAYTTNAQIIRNEAVPSGEGRIRIQTMLEAEAGDTLLLNITPRLGYNRAIPDADTVVDETKRRWREWFDAAPPVLDKYRKQYEYALWVMRAGLLSTRYFFTREACAPSKIHYVGVWHWDQFFHAIAYRHIDARLAEDQIRILLDHQQPNGMIPDAIHDEGLVTHLTKPVDADVTKPPLMAWTALKLYEKSGNRDFLQEIYEPLQRWHEWWQRENCEDGLYVYRHPFSSGLDDSPLWDEGMPVVAPDLNTYMVIQQESLARIAYILGEREDMERYREGANQLSECVRTRLWNEQGGIFNALYQDKPLATLTPFNLLPLWLDLPDAMTNRLLAHLTNPDEFWTEWPLPTVALNDPKFDAMQMWRGPTWVNINYLFIEILTRIGRLDLAQTLRRKTLDLIMQHSDIYEYYNPITGERPPKAAPIFGWTSAVFIDLVIQETEAAYANGMHS